MKKVLLIGLLLTGCAFSSGNYVVSHFDGSAYRIPVYNSVDLAEAESAIAYLRSKFGKEEYVVDVSKLSEAIAVKIHIGLPDKNQVGKSGTIYYLQKADFGWVVRESATWIE